MVARDASSVPSVMGTQRVAAHFKLPLVLLGPPSGGEMSKVGTIRQDMMALLEEREMNSLELSQTLGIQEKEVTAHLPHIARSAAGQGRRLMIRPPRCLACGYVFENRSRFTRPGRCPRCKETRVDRPAFRVDSQP